MASAAGAIGGALIAKRSADKAGRRQARGQRAAMATQERMFDRQLEFLRENRERQEPFRQAGLGALEQYQNLLEDPSALAEDPGLQFLQQQGQRQVESSGAARGMQLSGRQLGNLQERGQGIASQFRGQILGEIGQLINVGQAATSGQAAAGSQMAGAAGQTGVNLGNLQSALGGTQAAGAIGQGQAVAGGVAGVFDAVEGAGGFGNLFGGGTSLTADPFPGQPGR